METWESNNINLLLDKQEDFGRRNNGNNHNNLEIESIQMPLSNTLITQGKNKNEILTQTGRKKNSLNNEQLLNPSKTMLHRVKIIGVGGCGGNAVNNYVLANNNNDIYDITTISCNTDYQDLYRSVANTKFLLSDASTSGFGAGGNPSVGERASKACETNIRKILDNTDIAIIIAGMGGGTGTGSAPYISSVAQEMGILTVAIVTIPFIYEGKIRAENAQKGVDRMKRSVDTLFTIDNNKIKHVLPSNTSIKQAFIYCDKILIDIARTIIDTIIYGGYINLDFADIKSILKKTESAEIAKNGYIESFTLNIAENNSGKTIDLQEIDKILNFNLFIPDTKETKYDNLIINVQGQTENIPLNIFDEITSFITEKIANQNANIIVGLTDKQDLGHKIKISLFATQN